MKTLIQWWKARQLRLAREEYVRLKAQVDAMIILSQKFHICEEDRHKLVQLCGQQAKYEERVETLMRQ